MNGGGKRLLRGHIPQRQRAATPDPISILAVPDVGRNLFSVKQDGVLPEGASLAGIRRAVNHESNPRH